MCRHDSLGFRHARCEIIVRLRTPLVACRCIMYVHLDGFIGDMGDTLSTTSSNQYRIFMLVNRVIRHTKKPL
jgi:hypothetical protein